MAKLIHDLKYADRHDGRALLAGWLVGAGQDLFTDADLIVPVPLTRRRLIQRQFNQSALLARDVSRLTGIAWNARALAKLRETLPQVTLSGAARRQNLRGAFAVTTVGRSRLQGRRVVVIDDVVTTGATAEAAAKALLDAGAARVDILTLARVAASGPMTL
jgi:ComF family protein